MLARLNASYNYPRKVNQEQGNPSEPRVTFGIILRLRVYLENSWHISEHNPHLLNEKEAGRDSHPLKDVIEGEVCFAKEVLRGIEFV